MRAGQDGPSHTLAGASKASALTAGEHDPGLQRECETLQPLENAVPAVDLQDPDTTSEAVPTQKAASHQPEQASSEPFRFLDLPCELRLLVYSFLPITSRGLRIPAHSDLACKYDGHQIRCEDRCVFNENDYYVIHTKVYPVSILSTCRTIHDEAKGIVLAALHEIISTPLELTLSGRVADRPECIRNYFIVGAMKVLHTSFSNPWHLIFKYVSEGYVHGVQDEWPEDWRETWRNEWPAAWTPARAQEIRTAIWKSLDYTLLTFPPASVKVLRQHLRHWELFLELHYGDTPPEEGPECEIRVNYVAKTLDGPRPTEDLDELRSRFPGILKVKVSYAEMV